MAELQLVSATGFPCDPVAELRVADPHPVETPAPGMRTWKCGSIVVVDKTLASATNLVKLLPSCTVIAFQALSPAFSNCTMDYPYNKYLTGLLIGLCAMLSLLLSFTDSFIGRDGKLYYGIATLKGIYIINKSGGDGNGNGDCDNNMNLKDLKRFQIRWMDYIHAFLSLILFMSIALSDSDVQMCFAGNNKKVLPVNLPLGAMLLASIIFLIFPTSRKGVGYSEMVPLMQFA